MKIKRKRNLLAVIPVAALGITLTACSTGGSSNPPSGNQQESQQQQADTNSLETNQPLPHFNSSQERQNMIDIETAQADNVQTTSFFMNYGIPDPIGSCPSIGFGIPDSASLSNPFQAQWNDGYQSIAGVPVGQMDPTGIYAPTSSQGTFVICLTSGGQPYIDRVESQVNTYGGPATWNYSKHMGQLVGAPTAAAQIGKHTVAHGSTARKAQQVAGK